MTLDPHDSCTKNFGVIYESFSDGFEKHGLFSYDVPACIK